MLEQILESWPVGVLSTYGAHGIDSVPIVFALVDGVLYSPIDAKPKSGRELARIRNIEHDPNYTLLLQHYEDDWTRLWWLKLAGNASVIAVAGGAAPLEALETKYRQYRNSSLLDSTVQVLQLEILSHRSWAFQGEAWLARQFEQTGG